MNCPIETQESAGLLLDYCSRKLDPETTAVLERHIASCPACSEFARGQNAVWQALDAWEALPVSSDFDRRLYRRIEEQAPWWDRVLRPFRPVLVRQGLPVAAAACLVVMAGILLDRPAGVPRISGEPDAAQFEAVQPDQVEHALEDMEMLHELHALVREDTAQSNEL